jgi:hypothetical protein
MRCLLETNRPITLWYSSLCGIGRYRTGVYSATVTQIVLYESLQRDSVTDGTVLGIYTETVSQMVLCWGFTLRQCHKWYRAGDLH